MWYFEQILVTFWSFFNIYFLIYCLICKRLCVQTGPATVDFLYNLVQKENFGSHFCLGYVYKLCIAKQQQQNKNSEKKLFQFADKASCNEDEPLSKKKTKSK